MGIKLELFAIVASEKPGSPENLIGMITKDGGPLPCISTDRANIEEMFGRIGEAEKAAGHMRIVQFQEVVG